MVGRAQLSKRDRAHEFEKTQTGFAVFRALKLLVILRQDGVSGVSYRAIALNVGINHAIQIRRVALNVT